MAKLLSCFKAYDIRGQLGSELNNEIAYRIGRAFARVLALKTVVVGGDARATSAELKQALTEGLRDEGCDVFDLGLTGTEEIYFATSHLAMDGGVEVTASHNPIDYNGMKLVREHSRPISGDTGLVDIRTMAEQQPWLQELARPRSERGQLNSISVMPAYIEHLMSYIDISALSPMKLVVNAGNGAAGPVVDALAQRFFELSAPVEFIKINHKPDPNFPNGIPNPMLVENRAATRDAVLAHRADLGIAWDGDFDRCFLFDENGEFIEGYYIVGLLAVAFLQHFPGENIIYEPRLTWNTMEVVEQAGGKAILSKTGHAFIKERMRKENAIYGGEMSAHHYFRDFFYCDSGMIPWLLVIELLSRKQQSLSSMVAERIAAFPSPGEINSDLADPEAAIARVLAAYQDQALRVDHTDGICVEFSDWRFNLRTSNTEPVVRLNVETRGDRALMQTKTDEVLALLRQ